MSGVWQSPQRTRPSKDNLDTPGTCSVRLKVHSARVSSPIVSPAVERNHELELGAFEPGLAPASDASRPLTPAVNRG